MGYALVIDINENRDNIDLKVVPFKDGEKVGLENIYKLSNCECFDRVAFGEGIDIIVDDEGIYNKDYSINVGNKEGSSTDLFGTLLFLAVDEDTNYVPLSKKQLDYIKENILLNQLKVYKKKGN